MSPEHYLQKYFRLAIVKPKVIFCEPISINKVIVADVPFSPHCCRLLVPLFFFLSGEFTSGNKEMDPSLVYNSSLYLVRLG